MNIHLYTTDVTGLDLLKQMPAEFHVSTVLVPRNRLDSPKLKTLVAECSLPVVVHERGAREFESAIEPADMLICWMYSQIISRDLLATYQMGGLNMHGGSLPEYRGANVLNWAIANGAEELGVTWHAMVDEVDAGGIFSEGLVKVLPEDTAITMRQKQIEEGKRLFPLALQRFVSGVGPTRVPDLNSGVVWPSRRPCDSRIGSNWSLSRISNLIRAQIGPWPKATIWDGTEWKPVSSVSHAPTENSIPYELDTGDFVYLEYEATGKEP